MPTEDYLNDKVDPELEEKLAKNKPAETGEVKYIATCLSCGTERHFSKHIQLPIETYLLSVYCLTCQNRREFKLISGGQNELVPKIHT